MRTRIILALGLLSITATMSAQSAIDAYNVTPVQLRGSARFVGMGGAFTSLGSDITCMTQNPAGLGLYRSSDLSLSFDISIRNYASETSAQKNSENETLVKFDNFGYVGVANLSGTMKSFQWGVSYNRLAVLDRLTTGYNHPTGTSLTNYIAAYTNGTNSEDLIEDDNYNPYFTNINWLSILAYNSFMINNPGANQEQYSGLYQNGTDGDALYSVREKGYTDEYNIDFAGNVNDVVFWGLGVGIIDMNYSRQSFYSESMGGALVYNQQTKGVSTGKANFDLNNWQTINGSGANLKLGVIVRPVEMLRLGFAIHTPTWMHLNHNTYAKTSYEYLPDNAVGDRPINSGNYSTPTNDYDSKLNTPWRFMAGASVVIGPKAILSVDYERVAYNDIKLKEQRNFSENTYLGTGGFVDNVYANQDVKEYFRAANIIRIGAEYRLSRNWSVRAGYNYQSSNVRKEASSGNTYIATAGTDPSYQFDKDTQNICLGLGYKYKAWYIDMAYQHTRQAGTFRAYTPYENGNIIYNTPEAKTTNSYNNIVISTGFRF